MRDLANFVRSFFDSMLKKSRKEILKMKEKNYLEKDLSEELM